MMLRTAAVVLTLLFAQTAPALEGIDLSEPLPTPAPGECPRLVQIRYPFLGCGGATETASKVRPMNPNPAWNNARQIPRMSDWTEGDGAWGPDLNQD